MYMQLKPFWAVGVAGIIAFGCCATSAVAQRQADGTERSHASAGHEESSDEGTPVLGVVVAGHNDREGAEVVRVWPGSPAAKAGLQAGDQILKVGDQTIRSPESLRSAVLQHTPGEHISIEFTREDQSQSLDVELSGADGMFGWIRRGRIPETSEASGWLGVQVTPEKSPATHGVRVTRVLTGSPADMAGIENGDTILRIGDTPVEDAADLRKSIANTRPEESVKIAVQRGDQQKTLDVQLGTFARWHGDVAILTEPEARELLNELIAAPFALAEELLPDESPARQRLGKVVNLPQVGVCEVNATKGNQVNGTVLLREENDGLHLTGEINGLKAGKHGFHIHEFGDLRDTTGKAAGGHFNPRSQKHGGPEDKVHHAGDLGNIEAGEDGVAHVDIKAPWLKLHFVIGRSIVVHEGEDDLKSQPSGDAGKRAGVGIIGIANPAEPDSSSGTETAQSNSRRN
ncbi:MAG: PDZ domain-containing protein [Planctomycetaceae bacterium]|nr:PDZ domain-containing protein [Planctomycetaceae bacterium]